MTTASPTKLRDGSWGARVLGVAQRGQTITIRTRGGKHWDAEVTRVLWTGCDRDGGTVSLCATRSLDRHQAGGGVGGGQPRVREGTRRCWETGGRCYSDDGTKYCAECGENIYA